MSDLPDNAVDLGTVHFGYKDVYGPGRLLWLKDDPLPEPTLAEKMAVRYCNTLMSFNPHRWTGWAALNDTIRADCVKSMGEMLDEFDLVERSDVPKANQLEPLDYQLLDMCVGMAWQRTGDPYSSMVNRAVVDAVWAMFGRPKMPTQEQVEQAWWVTPCIGTSLPPERRVRLAELGILPEADDDE